MTSLATMTSVCPDWTLEEVVAGMQRHGYKGLEPRVEWGHASAIEKDLTAAARAEVRSRFQDAGLSICCLATGVRMATPETAERARHIEDLRRYIELAADLGCGLIRTFGGPRDASAPWAMVVDYTADGYREVVSEAQAAGVTVLMETHDDWCCSAPVRAVMDAVNHPNLRVLWDFMHTQRMMERPQDSFQALGHLTRHVHAHDGTYVDGSMQVSATLGDGIIDHAEPLQLLEARGFEGYFSVEVIHKPGSDHDADAVLSGYARGFEKLH
jgi:sugar phosphate isomerase/epimerase